MTSAKQPQTRPSSFPSTPLIRLRAPSPIPAPINALTFSSGTGQYLLTGSSDRLVRLYNPSTGTCIQSFSAHGYEILDLDVSADNAKFASVGGDKAVFVWDVASAQTIRRFAGHVGRVESVKFAGDGDSVLISGGFDGAVRIWDLRSHQSGKAIQVLSEARDAVSSVDVLGAEILAGSVDGRVRAYDLRNGEVVTDVVGPGKGVTSLQFMRDGEGYLAGSLDSRVRVMDRESGRCLQTFGGGGSLQGKGGDASDTFLNSEFRIRSTFALKDSLVLSGSEDGRVWAWDVLSGECVGKFWHVEDQGMGKSKKKKTDVVSAVAWNEARRQWASAGGDGTVVVWGDGA